MKKATNVIIIGRINVGKSSLFNKLTESSKALVSDIEGTTRDYNIGQVEWRKKTFNLIDTGGINIDILKNSIESLTKKKDKKLEENSTIEAGIVKQTKNALKKADIILMVVDGQAGVLPEDRQLALVVKKFGLPALLVCNKVDSKKWRNSLNEFYKLGLGEPIPVSAASGSGTGDFLDILVKQIKGTAGRPSTKEPERPIRVAMLGKPNVGKSSLTNKILGEERVIVSPQAQATRDPQDTEFEYKGKKILLIDTAGLRRKSKEDKGLEKDSSNKTIDVLRKADIVLMVTESQKKMTSQDLRLMSLVGEYQAGVVVVANKWDLIDDKDTETADQIKKYYLQTLHDLKWAPLLFVSGASGKGVHKILDTVLEVYEERGKKITDATLDKILKKILKRKKPVQGKGTQRPYLRKLVQLRSAPPIFQVEMYKGDSLHFSYRRFIVNQIRETFGFSGVPIKLIVDKTSKTKSKNK